MRVTLLTCADLPALTPDDERLARALRAQGVTVDVHPWSTFPPGCPGDVAVVRSAWDYHLDVERFTAWLETVEQQGVRLLNAPGLIRWNANKVYLRDLAAAGVALPPTEWLDDPDEARVAAALAMRGWPRAVLKPCVSASAHGTSVVTPGMVLAPGALAPLRAHGALLQRFVDEIERDGELSLVFFDGACSHAVLKRPRDGDFRVQQEFGGSEAAVTPPPGAVAFGERVLALCRDVPTYARVDLVTTPEGPVLMELELIEPMLYLGLAPGAADRCARAILARAPTSG
jgi:glutathione synthase/RimK-type ligase-like ATP-grasp enzyme